MIQLESIAFNHDPASATSDALNIRRNATGWVNVPEWSSGVSLNPEDSPAAYARSAVLGRTVTIQATFSASGPHPSAIEVRAVDNVVDPPGRGGCIGFILRLLHSLLRALFGNVLGEVAPTRVHFTAGVSGPVTFTLVGTRLDTAPVGVHTTEWRWQYRVRGRSWTDLAVTRHRIYVLLDVPTAPWQQSPYDPTNTQLPWAEVLDVACQWGILADTVDQAAAGVTASVYALGPNTVTYDCPNGGSTHYSYPNFDCAAFLERLHGGFGNGQYVNCTDCATIVTTFANALGANLWSSRMGWNFDLNELLGIGSSTWQTACGWGGFSYHEVGWAGGCTESDHVWDACLEVDGDADPTTAPHTALLPVDLRFGNPGDATYRDRLATPTGRTTCNPQPSSRVRRAVQ